MVLEARLVQGSVLKKIVESIKDLVTDANLDCAETGITLQVRVESTHPPLHCPPLTTAVLLSVACFRLWTSRMCPWWP